MTPVDHDILSAYFDGELSPEEAARVERLLAEEPAWASAWAGLRSLDAVLDAAVCPAAPRELASRIVAAAVVLAVVLVGPWRTGDGGADQPPVVASKPATNKPSDVADQPLAMTDVDNLAREQLLFFSNMESIQTLADNESLLSIDTLDALAILEAPGSGR